MFREVDWLMNEHPNPVTLPLARAAAGPHARILQCLPLNPKPTDERHFRANAPNIAILREAFHRA